MLVGQACWYVVRRPQPGPENKHAMRFTALLIEQSDEFNLKPGRLIMLEMFSRMSDEPSSVSCSGGEMNTALPEPPDWPGLSHCEPGQEPPEPRPAPGPNRQK